MADGNYIRMNVALKDAQICQSDIAEVAQWARQMKGLRIFRQRDKLAKMCADNDPTAKDKFTQVQDRLGVTDSSGLASTAKAKTLFDEISAVCGAIEASNIGEAAFQLEALTLA